MFSGILTGVVVDLQRPRCLFGRYRMNIFNRVIVIIGLLMTMVLSAVVFVATRAVVPMLLVFLERVQSNLDANRGISAVGQVGGGLLITLVIWVICAALLYLEFKRPKARTIKVHQVSGGEAELTADSIASRLEYNVDLLQDVVRVKPVVNNARRGIRVVLEVETSPEIDVPAKTDEIQSLAKDIVENRMGLRLDSVKVVMRHAPYPKKGVFKGRKQAPSPEPAPAAVEEAPAAPSEVEQPPADDWLAWPSEEAAEAASEEAVDDVYGGSDAEAEEEPRL
jgi:uncharacterized alkaline shock family protein YloU